MSTSRRTPTRSKQNTLALVGFRLSEGVKKNSVNCFSATVPVKEEGNKVGACRTFPDVFTADNESLPVVFLSKRSTQLHMETPSGRGEKKFEFQSDTVSAETKRLKPPLKNCLAHLQSWFLSFLMNDWVKSFQVISFSRVGDNKAVIKRWVSV